MRLYGSPPPRKPRKTEVLTSTNLSLDALPLPHLLAKTTIRDGLGLSSPKKRSVKDPRSKRLDRITVLLDYKFMMTVTRDLTSYVSEEAKSGLAGLTVQSGAGGTGTETRDAMTAPKQSHTMSQHLPHTCY